MASAQSSSGWAGLRLSDVTRATLATADDGDGLGHLATRPRKAWVWKARVV